MSSIDDTVELATKIFNIAARIAWVSGQAARLCLVAASGCVGWSIGRGLVWLVG